MQVWLIDEQGFYTWETKETLEEEKQDNQITIPPIYLDDNGYQKISIKPKWDGEKWIEGATSEEIAEWKEKNKPQPSEPTETQQLRADVDYIALEMGVDL